LFKPKSIQSIVSIRLIILALVPISKRLPNIIYCKIFLFDIKSCVYERARAHTHTKFLKFRDLRFGEAIEKSVHFLGHLMYV